MSVPKESSGFGAGFLAEELPIEAGAPEDGPIREEKIANAVQFLVHPKVQASSIEERRKFLDRKGLTSKGERLWTTHTLFVCDGLLNSQVLRDTADRRRPALQRLMMHSGQHSPSSTSSQQHAPGPVPPPDLRQWRRKPCRASSSRQRVPCGQPCHKHQPHSIPRL